MPFRDLAWEDLQRDYDIFPAYTDYLYGPDTRPKVGDEPGLHPLIFSLYPPAPIRYTDSMPSQSWPHYTVQSAVQPNHVDMNNKALTGSGLTRADSGGSFLVLDLRSPRGSPLSQLVPPQLVRMLYPEEMTSRSTLDVSQNLPTASPSAGLHSTQHAIRDSNQRISMWDSSNLYPAAAIRAPNPSSSATDIDEHIAHRTERTDLPLPSPLALHPSMASFTAQTPQPQSCFPFGPPGPIAPVTQVSPHISSTIPLVLPGEIITNSYYTFVGERNFQRINDHITTRWNIARDHPDVVLRAQAMMDLRKISTILHTKGKELEQQQEARNKWNLEQQINAEHQNALVVDCSMPEPPLQQNQPVPQLPEHVRKNIDRYIPRLWNYLHIIHSTSSIPSVSALEEKKIKENATQWVTNFRTSLPPGGREYVQGHLTQMIQAKSEGRDPLASIGG
ncbi:hypothetical protein BKA66DRAFT_570162 [Pyrenochaeta sp. MPI-SDFR-AT-0127]|nr:hypothetical protein BKA66DRAFT_570162 [Pyrenochaeta sp. MPI-SDFR-AT-0127]